MLYIGIDPGKSGGIAILDEDGTVQALSTMPDTPRGVLEFLNDHAGMDDACAMLEHVRSSPQMGVVSAFTFGRGVGILEACLAAAAIPYDTVTPQKWQTAMQCRSGGDKNITKARAAQLFARVRMTHAFADCLLIAEYCRRVHRGTLPQKAARSHVQKAKAPLLNGSREQQVEFFDALDEIVNKQWSAEEQQARVAEARPTLATPAGDGAGPRRRARPRV